MRIQHYRDTSLFLERARPYLLRAEAENGMLLAIGSRVLDEQCYLVTLEEAGEVVGCAARTPPYGLVITRAGTEALDPLIVDVAAAYETLPSVLGPEPTASAFAERWAHLKGTSTRPIMRMRLFETRRVQAPSLPPPGHLRLGMESELSTLTAWVAAFHQEARTGNPVDPERTTRDQLANHELYVWDHHGPVSIAIYAGRTDRSARIGLAYTHPDHRGRGYASALVAGLTQQLLNEGLAFCCINTDLANPTTNKIYPAIGYHPVCDISNIDLTAG